MFKNIQLKTDTDCYKSCMNSIFNINNKIKENFKLLTKYNNTYDLRKDNSLCPIFDYNNSFLQILFENNIINELEELAGKKVYLYHIQYRNAFPANFSYQQWHRDTNYRGNKIITGSLPPPFKVIFFPKIHDNKEVALNVMPNTHLSYKNNGKHFDDYKIDEFIKKHTDYNEKTVDIYPDDKFLLFNTSLYHNAVMPKTKYQPRIIYSFTTDKENIKKYIKEKNFDSNLINNFINYS